MFERRNGTPSRTAGGLRGALAATLVTAVALTAAGCGRDETPQVIDTPQPSVPAGQRDQLAGLAATAKDKRYVATYKLAGARTPDKSVTVTVAVATDGAWVVAVPAGALGGLADIAIFHSGAGTFQCTLGPAAGTEGSRPDLGTIAPGCVLAPTLPAGNDPRVQHVFTDWIDAMIDRTTALSVAATPLLPGAGGQCFSVESTAAAMAPPVDPGTYCYTRDGVLTAARVSFGTLTLSGPVAAAPPSVTMPGPVVTRPLLAVAAPPAPPPPTSPPPASVPAVPAHAARGQGVR